MHVTVLEVTSWACHHEQGVSQCWARTGCEGPCRYIHLIHLTCRPRWESRMG